MSSPVHQTQSDHTGPPPSAGRRHRLAQLAALVALIGSVGISALVLRVVVSDPVSVVLMFALVFLVAFFGWLVLTRRSRMRLLGLPVIVFGLVGLGAFAYDHKVALPALIGVFALFGLAARYAVRHSRMTEELAGRHARPANPARKGVLIINPKSGGGKAERFNLPTEARKRAVTQGADVIGMAGGDGSQALVARVAMHRDVAHVCVPAGTRNHLALDLGLDRDDVVGALDAFTDG